MDFEMAVLRLNLQSYGVEPGHDQGILPGEITCFTDSVQAALRTIAYLSADLKEFLPYSQDTGSSPRSPCPDSLTWLTSSRFVSCRLLSHLRQRFHRFVAGQESDADERADEASLAEGDARRDASLQVHR